jgi:GNAT superfamily N-acetyltransferase
MPRRAPTLGGRRFVYSHAVPDSLRTLYDDEMRRRILPPPGRWIDDDGVLTRVVGPSLHALDHTVFHSRLTAHSADAVITAEVERAKRGRHGLQWNFYDGDEPPDLIDRLVRSGLREQARETVLVMPSDDVRLRTEPPTGIEIRRVTHESGLADFVAVDEAVWGSQFTAWTRSWFLPALAGDADPVGIFVAYAEGTPVGCAWVWPPPGRSFAYLFGGTVLATHRGRGVYRALVSARARVAIDAKIPWLVTDANDHSAPVLRRVGFSPIARRTEMVLAAPGDGSAV